MSSNRTRAWKPIAIFVAAFGVGLVATIAACSSSSSSGEASADGDAGTGSDSGAACTQCVSDKDCNGGVCAQIGGDSYCAALCPKGSGCGGGASCIQVVTAEGAQSSACVPANECGGSVGGEDAGPPASETCGALDGPDVTAGCTCSSPTPSNCQKNGCYGGFWCNTTSKSCQPAPAPSSCMDAGTIPPSPDAGPVVGTVTATGGSVSRLLFAVVGDTRPATEDDIGGYPSAIISGLYTDIQSLSQVPSFVVTTGDYQFSNPSGTSAAPQLDLYVTARANFKGVSFPTMGNHECTGATISNCGTGNTDGITANYTAFMDKLVTPIGQSKPYYEIDIDALDKSWTSKFVYVAANAWDATQSSWFDAAMAKATTYTFVVRHESASTSPAPPGVAASEAIMAKYPYTLSIVGHTHSYYHAKGAREVLVGNGGAPLTSKNYGYAIISQRLDGALVGDMIDATTKLPDTYFHFVVKADGTFTQ